MSVTARVLLCTCPPEAAGDVARGLLERRLAACVNAVPGVVSRYWWKDAIEEDSETLLLIKTDQKHVAAIIDALAELHPYDVPELLVLPVESGAEPYLRWMRDVT